MVYSKFFGEKLDFEQQRIRDLGFQKLEKLTSLKSRVPAQLLIECLAHPYQFIRIAAVEQAGKYCRKDFTRIFAVALNDRCDYVVQAAAEALAKINTDEALEILGNAFFEDVIERPHHIADAIAQFGIKGFDVLSKAAQSSSPNLRYYAAKGLGATGLEPARAMLEEMEKNDNAKTSFSGAVSTAARKALKSLTSIQNSKSNE